METQKCISLALEKLVVPANGLPSLPQTGETDHRLEVVVVFTSVEGTIAALKSASNLVRGLRAHITLVVPQIVPYALPLESPPTLLDFSQRRLSEIASESRVETIVRLYLCRNPLETVTAVLKPRSLVVVGSHRRWWPTREQSLARKLQRAGHEVIFTETA